MDNIDKIRQKATVEIKDKAKKIPGYLHPLNKERLNDMKRLMFTSGNEFTEWMRQNGIIKSTIKADLKNTGYKTRAEYTNKCAQNAGFKDYNEKRNEWRYKTGRSSPSGFDENSPDWFGSFTENLMIHRYPEAIKMHDKNPGFDFLWKDKTGKDIKIDNKGRYLFYSDNQKPQLSFQIKHNNIAERFILSGWNNRIELNPLIVFEFKKNDLIRKGKGRYATKVEFWKRDTFAITYTPEELEKFEDYRIDINWLKDLVNKSK